MDAGLGRRHVTVRVAPIGKRRGISGSILATSPVHLVLYKCVIPADTCGVPTPSGNVLLCVTHRICLFED